MSGRVNEKTASIYTGQLTDENKVNIQLVVIIDFFLTLYDAITGTILGGRDAQPVINQNHVVISSSGFITWNLQEADNALINQSLDTELHIALFTGHYTSADGARPFKHIFPFRVVNLTKVL